MKLKLKNIGAIHEAEVELKGLCVIAGKNDTGKSTVGKSLFAIIKGQSLKKNALHDIKIKTLRNLTKHIPSNISRLELDVFLNFFESVFDNISTDNTSSNEEIIQSVSRKLEAIFPGILKESLLKEELLRLIPNNSNEKKEQKNEHAKELLKNLFEGEISNKIAKSANKKAPAHICLKNEGEKLFEAEIINDSFKKMSYGKPFKWNEAVYIDTPAVLDTARYLRDELIQERNDKIRRYFMETKLDLCKKLVLPNSPKNTTHINAIKEIAELITGQFDYDNDKNDFALIKKGGYKYRQNSLASGVKTFGILQLLLKEGYINENSLLIIDEPEVHLHPEWQIEYAKLICDLVEQNVPVLLNTHSSTIIDVISAIGVKKFPDKLNFYLADKDDEQHVFIDDVSDKIERIYEKIAKPIQKFIFNN